ncbi:hypothetical protein C8A01DRAFT_38970 [Parachaetomium inaequale]|uniref:Uncharacterized protein n=1 Tax=Parachaetomium inaequale TaxID=2588326 RepID=A0AAN6PA66_9PEZI|nr:hypothetical protein C8A01DRAFT_38970 [Parachaetomium inaequale]
MAPPNPITLPPRFEIRKLEPQHHDWVKALVAHSNAFHSPVFAVAYPHNQTPRAYAMFRAGDYHASHSINSGLSYGVFDTQFQFHHPSSSSAEAGGQLLWDFSDTTATASQLLTQMDFPLVSLALSYDGIHPFDFAQLTPLLQALPLLGTVFAALEKRDTRAPESWKPRREGEVVLRSGTCTRADYGGMGLAKGLAHWLMFEARGRGYRGVQIETAHEAVERVWMNPPAGFKAEMVGAFETGSYEEEVERRGMVRVFEPAQLRCTKIWVDLLGASA